MTHPNGAHAYADLGPTPEELAHLEAVIEEIRAAELDALPDGDYGPWHDSAGLSSFEAAGAQIDLALASEAARQAEDALPPQRTSEERFAHALGRIAAGTYTLANYYREPEPSYGCGTLDAYGRCAARYHQAGCMETVTGSAATGNHTAAGAWRQALLSSPTSADVELARRTGMDWEDVLDAGPAGHLTLAHMRQVLGITKADLPARPPPSTAAQQMRLY